MKLAKFKPTTGMHPFTVSHLDGLLEIRTDTEDLCFWPCPYGNNEIVFDGFVKCDGGIRHLVHRYTRVTVHGAALDTLRYGNLSRRPYQLAQPCDGSILVACWLCSFNGATIPIGVRTQFIGTLIRTSRRRHGMKSSPRPSGKALPIQRGGMKRRRWDCSHHCTQSITTRWQASCWS
jgi:hypothetical protein